MLKQQHEWEINRKDAVNQMLDKDLNEGEIV